MRRERKISPQGVVYPVNRVYADLVPSSGRTSPIGLGELTEELSAAWRSRTQTQLFRQPYVSFLYER